MLCYPKQLQQDQDVSCETLHLYLSGFTRLMDSVWNLLSFIFGPVFPIAEQKKMKY